MKHLISMLQKEARKNRKTYVAELKNSADIVSNRYLSQYGTSTKLKKFAADKKKLTEYLLFRYDEKETKVFNDQLTELYNITTSGDLIRLKISVTWAKSATWGANPTAEVWAQYQTPKGIEGHTYTSRSVSGCGYDKLSTAIAEALNQIPQIKNALYKLKNKNIKTPNRELFGYGSGYSSLPSFEGGVGVSCYYAIFEKIGFKLTSIAGGKSYDVYTVERV